MKDITLILDTSILKKHQSLKTTEFDTIVELSRIQAINFQLPELVNKEFLSHLLSEIESHYENIIKSLRQLNKKTKVTEFDVESEIERFIELKAKEIKIITDNWRNYRRQNNISLINFSTFGISKVFDDYFSGKLPFTQPKNRKDLPDSFILHSILSNHEKNSYFICADNALKEAAESHGIKTLDNINDFLLLPEIIKKTKELENLTGIKNQMELIQEKHDYLKGWLINYLNKNLPIDLYNSQGESSRSKDKMVEIKDINWIKFDFDKARLHSENRLVIPVHFNISIILQMTYTHEYILEKSSKTWFLKHIELIKVKEVEEGLVVKEPFTGSLGLSINIFVNEPFELKEEGIIYSDITKDFLFSDIKIEEYFKNS